MSWELTDLDFDGKTAHVVAKFTHSETGAQHRLQIVLGCDSCALCGHVIPKNNLGEINIRAIIAAEHVELEKVHAQTLAVVRKHNVPLRKKDK